MDTTKKKVMVMVDTAATTRDMEEDMVEAMMEDMDSADTIQHVDAAVAEVAVDLVDEEDEYSLVDEEMSLKVVLKVALLPKEELKVPMKCQPMDKKETLLLVLIILLLWSKLLTVVVEGIVAEDVLEDVEEVEDDSGVDTMLFI